MKVSVNVTVHLDAILHFLNSPIKFKSIKQLWKVKGDVDLIVNVIIPLDDDIILCIKVITLNFTFIDFF